MNVDYLFQAAGTERDVPVLPAGRAGDVGVLHQPGVARRGARAPWRRDNRTWLLLGAAVAALIPTLLYYGGGWLQYGYRYFLDSIPFIWALCAMAVASRGRVGRIWWAAILFGVVINAAGVLGLSPGCAARRLRRPQEAHRAIDGGSIGPHTSARPRGQMTVTGQGHGCEHSAANR